MNDLATITKAFQMLRTRPGDLQTIAGPEIQLPGRQARKAG